MAVTPAGAFRAQPPTDDTPTVTEGPLLVFSGARLEGDGPWTSYLGGGADRELVLTVGNVGDEPSPATSISLTLEKGADLRADESVLTLEPLEPGESTTIRLDVRLPAFALGTYGVEGSVPDITATSFRAETTHIPWVLVLLPLLVLVQVALVGARNRVRRFLHPEGQRERTSESEMAPTPPPVVADAEPFGDELAAAVSQELVAVFGGGIDERGILTDDERADLVVDLTAEVADRVAGRVDLSGPEQDALRAELAEVMAVAHARSADADVDADLDAGVDVDVDAEPATTG